MEKSQELCPLKLAFDRFLAVVALMFWGAVGVVFLISKLFGSYLGDPIMDSTINGNLLYAMAVLLLFKFHYSGNWPSINPLKMDPLGKVVAGIIGEVKIFSILYVIGILWEKILLRIEGIWNVSLIAEQPLIESLHSDLTREGQLIGIILLTVILAPIAEELIFRYFLYRVCKSWMSSPKAMLLAAFIFALLHFNLMAFVPLFVMGIFLVRLYERHGNLIPCIIVHGLFNYISILMVLLFSEKLSM
ncbi:MAG: CPBP family intramembrane metalloprotease [Puniceicoccales bacterium]|nr:CPBP family intramembrane metalloprotease [Puniceicoccales bacterium]